MSRSKGLTVLAALIFGLMSTTASAQFAERKIRIGTGLAEDNHVGIGLKKMAEVLDAKSGGKMKLVAYYSGALGPDMQGVQALRSGTQEMVLTSSSPVSSLVKELGVLDLPFLVSSGEEIDAVLDGPAGDYFNKRLEKLDLINLAYWENGFRNLTNSKRPVAKLEDFEGLKIRVMQNPVFLDSFKAWGANPVPLAFGEVYTALEMKAVDGQENPYITIETSKFSEVQKYLSITRHAYTANLILYSKKLWDQLSNDERAALQEAAIVARDVQRKAARIADDESLERLKKAGMNVNDVPQAERDRMLAKIKPVYDNILAGYDKEGPDLVFETLKKVRGK
ncbi:ABC transporter substrate-binding protein [Betaproteobacteria bacterium]|nr:ABC transporter substrate-binding protein [Betaproteobacteria bacterium]